MTDEEIEQAAKEELESTQTIQFNKARENSILYEALPEGVSAQQLQTQHPNNNIQIMVDFLANRVAASMGLSKVFATGNPEDGNWRANQLFSFPAILELQKELEKICDWIFFRYVNFIVRHGELEYIDPDVMDYVDWQWRKIDDIDAVATQNGIRLALENCTTTYKDVLGNDWQETLRQVAFERKWMRENGIVPPQDLMISGGQTEQSKADGQLV